MGGLARREARSEIVVPPALRGRGHHLLRDGIGYSVHQSSSFSGLAAFGAGAGAGAPLPPGCRGGCGVEAPFPPCRAATCAGLRTGGALPAGALSVMACFAGGAATVWSMFGIAAPSCPPSS